ncbi:exodeoxyribonuclease VII large subunit [Rhizobium sp. Root274]|uniref:exodeoxyribonuclease VII large subunit n=1 Tax=unclassified Rhizobium TaxID=2613769 RepID=UPI00071607CA|nr:MULTISPECIES: exodeoxyribonuclease VII large subunit [unclassified Rhizobium]KQW32004.1 exodeoxyribonuclease VII large subunit [Rhizobium sp. Root1240]KRD33542.1 exodeoxyribonuclease VII large subunit [Rhizobium sp. Root274]
MSNFFDSDSPTNLTEFSVSELSGSIKRTIETAFDHVRVRGEISGYRGPHSSGHAYFSLKDDKARIDAVVWKGSFSKLKYRPEEGMEVIATGRITTFPGSSKYQIVIEQMEPAGAGALMALIEERKRRFTAEGLFDPAAKQLLPFLPKVIGVVTSPTGAVIRDILHRISDRFPVHVLVWPVKVQGEGSGDEVANAVRGFNAFSPGGDLPRPDVLIVARGGGSLEDLWSFNDEAVVRAAAASDIPLISAVGHETDWTLIDYAADVRAPTPTGAAEMAVPVKADLEAQVATLSARLSGAMNRQMDSRRQNLRALVRALPSLDQLLALPRRRFDEAAAGLGRSLELNTMNKRRTFERAAAKLSPDMLARRLVERRQRLAERTALAERIIERLLDRNKARLDRFDATLNAMPSRLKAMTERARDRIEGFGRRADTAVVGDLRRARQALIAQDRVLQSLSYKNVLQRGYAVIRDADDRPVSRAAALAHGQAIAIELADGRVAAVAGEGVAPREPLVAQPSRSAPAQKQPRKSEPPAGQGSLF